MKEFSRALDKLKKVKNQLLAKAEDTGELDQKAFQGWAEECMVSLLKADEHETKMQVLLTKVDRTEEVGKDLAVYERLLKECTDGEATTGHLLEGVGHALTRFKKFLA